MNHHIKSWPEYFQALLDGEKTFEARKNDRDYQAGDFLTIKEYDPAKNAYTGRALHARVHYVLYGGHFGLAPGYCILSLKGVQRCQEVPT